MLRYVVGDTRDVTATIPDDSIDLIFCSPPFLALRSYLPSSHPDKHREIGSEPNPAQFLDTLLELTAEWGRVLAPHGTIAIELGDTYSSGDGSGWPNSKSLALIPQLYAVALAYGINPLTGQPSPAGRWRVRNWIAWHRPNPPVGALGDKWRPASSYITTACRGQRRWFDLDSVRYEAQDVNPRNTNGPKSKDADSAEVLVSFDQRVGSNPAGAPPLDWHTDGDLGTGHIILTTQPYAGSHYATFPMELPRKIIGCMCPRAVCRVCGVARERIVNDTSAFEPQAELAAHIKERRQALGITQGQIKEWFGYTGNTIGHWEDVTSQPTVPNQTVWPMLKERLGLDDRFDAFVMGERKWTEFAGEYIHNGAAVDRTARVTGDFQGSGSAGKVDGATTRRAVTLGWSDCGHDNYRPGHVLDPFAGTGTTLAAAQDLGRDATGIDIDEENAWLARERCGMFATFEHFERPVVDTADL